MIYGDGGSIFYLQGLFLQQPLEYIKLAFRNDDFQFSLHATMEAYEEEILPSEVKEVVKDGQILEDYPAHLRGPCCLIYGRNKGGRDIYVVCTSMGSPIVVITVYEPKEPKWITPRQRRRE